MTPSVSHVRLATGLAYEVLSFAPADPGCDRTLLLLHGFLDLAWGWLPVVESGLFSDHHVLVPSFRGHGASDWIGEGGTYYFLDYVADLESLVAQLARPRLSIIGHSMGGMVASLFAGTYPDRVEKVGLLEGLSVPEMPTGPSRMRDAVTGRAQALRQRGTQAQPGSRRYPSIAAAAERMRHHDPRLDPALARMVCEHGCLQLPTGEWVFRHDPLHAPRTPVGFELSISERFWSAVTADVLYLEGADSLMRLGGEQRDRRLSAFTKARSFHEVTVPDAGHMMLRHQPAATAQAMADFLA